MSKPIKIEYLADVAQYLRETKRIEVSTEDIADALVATSHDAEDLERKLSRAMRDAAKDTETLERAIRDLPDATEEAADQAERDMHRMGDSAGEAGRDMGESFRGSLGESLASGGGDLSESLSETLGEVVGNAPLPLAAIGGLALAVWNHFKAESEQQKQSVAETFDLFDEVTGQLDRLALLDKALEDLGGTKAQGLEDASTYAAEMGLSMEEVATLITGEINPASEQTYKNLKAWREQAVQGENATADQVEAYEALMDVTDQNRASVEKATEAQRLWSEVTTEHVKVAGDIKSHYQGAYEYIKGMDAGIRGLPKTFQMDIITTAKGPMAGYVDPSSPGYSPGHVAIASSAIRNRAQ